MTVCFVNKSTFHLPRNSNKGRKIKSQLRQILYLDLTSQHAQRELGAEVEDGQRFHPGTDTHSFLGLRQGIYISMEFHWQRNNPQCLSFPSCEMGIGARSHICSSFDPPCAA